VKIAGLTTASAEQLITKRLRDSNYVLDPQVNVMVREYATQAVSVLGEVRKPGPYTLLGAHTLLDAIATAGGLTTDAGNTVTITRAGSTQPTVIRLNTMPGESWKANPGVYPGDRIEVDHAPVVYVVGEVVRPGGFSVGNRQKLTVLKAIALAQGFNRTAALNKVRVLRRTGTAIEEQPLAVKLIMKGKAPDIELQDSDVLVVPGSGAKSALKSASSIFQAAAQSAIYHY
jgi:polysaccharide export outer membrane protein